MITRGYIVGEIIDGLSSISQQVNTRCKLGLTDLNRYLEDFFKEYLNEVLDWSLTNLNNERSNEPGLDLGDRSKSVAVQVTSSRTSDKVNSTLEKVLNREDKFDFIVLLIIGNKQVTYSLKDSLCKQTGFKESNIWDINDLCIKTLSLPLDRLQRLHEIVKSNLAKVTIELEIPDDEGNFLTTIDSYIEKLPKPQMSDFKSIYEFNKSEVAEYEYSPEKIKENFTQFSKELSKLPRITREFYAFLLERREDDEDSPSNSYFCECFYFNYNKLKRICNFPNLNEELTILEEHRLVDIQEAIEDGSPFVRIFATKVDIDNFIYDLVSYIEHKDIGYRKPIVSLDFSEF
ncbi:SMEK domain-containing protein [Vibrio kanaloae]|uniref:SMEK domain-containing protein n=1 Tax=Vibrio kanaloae TaxID=170673 RepID=UPI0035A57C46